MTSARWHASDRREHLPRDWHKRRRRVLRRDPVCTLRLDVCTYTSTEVDHIGDRDDHREQMLRGVCEDCHKKRTQEQANEGRRRRTRPPEPTPGVI